MLRTAAGRTRESHIAPERIAERVLARIRAADAKKPRLTTAFPRLTPAAALVVVALVLAAVPVLAYVGHKV